MSAPNRSPATGARDWFWPRTGHAAINPHMKLTRFAFGAVFATFALVLTSPFHARAAVKEPVAVRYAWSNNPDCTLFNGAGLPASPFRTDDWK
jgi:hypothetical protein